MSKIEFKDKFTLDGYAKPGVGVTKAKVAKVKQLMEAAIRGDKIANATLAETVTTSDAIFNAAFLSQIQFIPQFLELPRTWSTIAGVRTLPDFRPAVLRGIFGEFEGLERDDAGPDNPAGIAPVVAELAPYPYATVGSVEAAYGRLKKRGFKTGYSWEASINEDAAGFFADLPGEMLRVALDTEEYEVYSALIGALGAGQQLQAGTTYSGESVLVNAPFSRQALSLLIEQMALRPVNGRYVGRSSTGYAVIVPIGAGDSARFELTQAIIQVQDGSFILSAQDQGFGNIEIVESEYVTGTAWYVVPRPGGLRRPFLELGRLRGHEAPEIRVENATGTFQGGSAVSPFEGSFQNDSIDMRLRMPVAGLVWFSTLGGWSSGAGV